MVRLSRFAAALALLVAAFTQASGHAQAGAGQAQSGQPQTCQAQPAQPQAGQAPAGQTPAPQPDGQQPGGNQEPGLHAKPPAGNHQPVFRAGINFVRVDVIVTDKNGNPVGDLKPEDFEITEEG